MSKRRLFCALIFLCATSIAALAQQGTPTPASSGTPTPRKKSGPNELGLLQKDRPKGAKTEITSKSGATFDNASSIATFDGSVVVKDPQFNLFCDKLTVYLNKERKGIDHAVAEGKVVIVQENTNDKGEKVKSVGRSGKAVFVPATGDVTLTVWPSLQQGVNNHLSVDQNTVMILNRAGRLTTQGASRTMIIDADDAGGL